MSNRRGISTAGVIAGVVIVALLASIAVPVAGLVASRQNRAAWAATMETFVKQLTRYRRENGAFPFESSRGEPGLTFNATSAYNPRLPFPIGEEVALEWATPVSTAWQQLGNYGATIPTTRVRFYLYSSRLSTSAGTTTYAYLEAQHDFDGDGVPAFAYTTLSDSTGGEPVRIDVGWDSTE